MSSFQVKSRCLWTSMGDSWMCKCLLLLGACRCPSKMGSGKETEQDEEQKAAAQIALCGQLPRGHCFPPSVLYPNSDLAPGCSAAEGAILPKARMRAQLLWASQGSFISTPRGVSCSPIAGASTCPQGDRAGNRVPSLGESRVVHPFCCHVLSLPILPAWAVAAVHPGFPQHKALCNIRGVGSLTFFFFLRSSKCTLAGQTSFWEELGQRVQQSSPIPSISFWFN